MKRNIDDLVAVARKDFYAFVGKAFQIVNPNTEYLANWHVETIAWHLQQCAEGKIKRLIINVPPRHLKSITASVAFAAWVLGHDPSCNVVCVSYSNELATKHHRDFRTLVESRDYKRMFKNMRIDRRKNTELELATTKNGGRYATSVEGTLTGRGGDIIIVDDPIKPDSAMSEAERTHANEWYSSTVYTRLNNQKDGVLIIVMHRLHEDDLVGHVMELDDWTVLNIPAIATERMVYRTGPRGKRHNREIGEVIDPRREDQADLDRIKRNMGSYNFAAQFQQNPMPVEGNLVKREWFSTYENLPERDEFDAVVQSWDTATKAGELNDFSVCTTWGVLGEKYYLINVMRRKLDYHELERLAIDLADEHRPDIVLVEAMGTGTVLSQELHRRLPARVWGMHPRGDKEVRFAAQSFLIEQGRVHLPPQAPWLDTLIAELLAFPGSKHDDQVDSVEMFLRYMRGIGGEFGPMESPNPNQRRPRRRRPRRGSINRGGQPSPTGVGLYIAPSY